MSDDLLQDLRRRLAALEQVPVGAHPDVLDDLHRRLVAELEGLGTSRGIGAQPPDERA